MFNQLTLLGNLTRDIELRYAQSGSAIASTGIATSHKFKVNDEQREEVMFIDLTFFGRSGEIANQYLRKGSKVFITGRLKLDQWDDATTGAKRSKHTVIVETMKMLDSKPTGEHNPDAKPYEPPTPTYEKPTPKQMPENNLPEIDINEDEIPFQGKNMIIKKYKTFTIQNDTFSTWWKIFNAYEFIAYVPTEEEARRVVWLKSGKGEPITDEMMEMVP